VLSGLLTIPRLRLFVLTGFAYFVGLGVIMAGFLASLSSWPFANTLITLGAITRLLGACCTVGWLVATIIELNVRGRRGIDGVVSLWLAAGYLVAFELYSAYVVLRYSLFGEVWQGIMWSNQYIIFALASLILLTYKAAVALEVREGYDKTTRGSRWLDWLLFFFSPVGLWILQPRIRAASSRANPAVALEDHLVG